jgi:hypothetical protein
MQVNSLNHRWCVTGLGAVLCLLAAVFSFEAKIAWYSHAPAHTEISAAKLQATDTARQVQTLVTQAAGSPAGFPHLSLQLAWLVLFALSATALAHCRRVDSDLTEAYTFSGFSPFRFSRPPPRR